MESLENSFNDILNAAAAVGRDDQINQSGSGESKKSRNYQRKYRDLLKKYQELQRDQEDTFGIHADTVIQLQDTIREKERLLLLKTLPNTEGKVPPQNDSVGRMQSAQMPKSVSDDRDREYNDNNENENSKRLIEMLKTKMDIMRLTMEETGRKYELLQQRDRDTIAHLSHCIQDLESKLVYSANQVTVLSSTSANLKLFLNKLLDGVNTTLVGIECQKLQHEDQLQQLREIYVSESQAGIEKTMTINELHATISEKNREIGVLRGWLTRIKRDLRNKDIKERLL